MTRRTRGRTAMWAAVALVAIASCSCAEPAAERTTSADAPARPTTEPSPTTAIDVSPDGTAAGPDDVAVLAPASSEPWNNLTPAHEAHRAPVRLVIEALAVDAPIAPMGIDADGALDLPADNRTVAWFADGSAPGDPGSALLAAHVDHDGRAGVFYDLRTLVPGTEVRVEIADGTVMRYVIEDAARNVNKSALPDELVFRTEGPSTLVLVTCGGRFDRAARSYEENTILTARPRP